MGSLVREKHGIFDVKCGFFIHEVIAEAIVLSAQRPKRKKSRTVRFLFNGVTVCVRSDSNPVLILRDWTRAVDGCIRKNIGPYPKSALADEEMARDERKRQARRAKGVSEFMSEFLRESGGPL